MKHQRFQPRSLIGILVLVLAAWFAWRDPLGIARLSPEAPKGFVMLYLGVAAVAVLNGVRAFMFAARGEWRRGWFEGLQGALSLLRAILLALSIPDHTVLVWIAIACLAATGVVGKLERGTSTQDSRIAFGSLKHK